MSNNYPTLSDLVSAMNGNPTTNQWDIVCSYSVKQLNTFLQSQYDAGKLAKEVQFTTQREDPFSGDNFTIAYDLTFDSPKISFLDGNPGYSKIVMPIQKGSYSITPGGATQPSKLVDLPASKYSIEGIIPLAAINGTTGNIVEHSDIVTFSNGKAEDNHVVIHFNNVKGATYRIIPEPDPADKDLLVTYFLPLINQYFSGIKETDYALASVNNTLPDQEVSIFTPKSFVFTSIGDDDQGILSLYIQTQESGNPQGNASPSFQPHDQQLFPIPEGYTASIIISYSLLTSFLSKQLTARGFEASFETVQQGISASLTKDGSVVAPNKDGNYIFGSCNYKGLDISLKDYPLTFDIADGQANLKWRGTTTSNWSTYIVGSTRPSNGTVDVTISLNKGPFKIKVNEVFDDEKKDQDISIANIVVDKSDLTVSTDAHTCSFLETLGGCSETVPAYYSNEMALSIPDITVTLPKLGFFLDTNLLAPGEQVVTIDTKAGVQTPHDFLVVGQVISRSTKS